LGGIVPEVRNMALCRHPVGTSGMLYVWSQKPDGQSFDKAVISAHGRQANINGMQDAPPQCELVYYCPHGNNLMDPTVQCILSEHIKPLERVQATASQDYIVSKYQNSTRTPRNTMGESHASIRVADETAADLANSYEVLVNQYRGDLSRLDEELATLQDVDEKYYFERKKQRALDSISKLEALIKRYGELKMDIVTIRSKAGHLPLSTVLVELYRFGFHFKEIHCSFCRGRSRYSPGYEPKKADLWQ
jgi:hypothetical protein